MNNTIVVDTSVLISALIGTQGASREVLRRCLQEVYKPLLSNTLFLEYEEVSQRKRIVDSSPLSSNEIKALLNAFYKTCQWTSIYYLWRPNLKDEGNNFLIELALAGNASSIITSNIKDFKNAQLKFSNLIVKKPEQLLQGK